MDTVTATAQINNKYYAHVSHNSHHGVHRDYPELLQHLFSISLLFIKNSDFRHFLHIFTFSPFFWYGYTKTRQARQNRPRRSQTKKWLVLSGFLHQKFAGKLKEVGQIVPDSTRLCLFFVNKGKFWCCLAQSVQLPSTFLQTSGARSQIEPAIFLSGSVWLRLAWFCLVRLVLV